MFRLTLLCIFATVITSSFQDELNFINHSPYQTLYRRDYTAFTNWLDCKEKISVLFYYEPQADTGAATRLSSFKLDPAVPKSCQQQNGNSYGSLYDRGHLVPANHMDFSDITIAESNYMTNILPQIKYLNRGAWLQSEEITECLRDTRKLIVIGGIVMGDNADNDIVLPTQGIRTPDWFWKIIYDVTNDQLIAWNMPNDETAVRSNLDKFLVSVSEIEELTGFIFTDFTEEQKNVKLEKSWPVPQGCDLSK